MGAVGDSSDSATNADAWDLLGSSLVPDQHTNLITDLTSSGLGEGSVQLACVTESAVTFGCSIGFHAVFASGIGTVGSQTHEIPLSANTVQRVGVGILGEAEFTSSHSSRGAALALDKGCLNRLN